MSSYTVENRFKPVLSPLPINGLMYLAKHAAIFSRINKLNKMSPMPTRYHNYFRLRLYSDIALPLLVS